MKKITAFFLALFILSASLFAQSNLTSVSYNKTSQPGLMIELPYNQDVSEGFIIANLKKTGYDAETKGKLFWKQNKLNGFYVFKDVRLEGTAEPVDLYFKVESKGKKQKDQSIIYLLMGKSDGTFISSAEETTYAAGKKFLNNFPVQSEAYKLDLDIKAQEDAVKTAEKKYDKLKDEEKSLSKKIEQLQDDLKNNRQDQENQQKTIDNERTKLADLRSKKS
jgi:hypothetical protein